MGKGADMSWEDIQNEFDIMNRMSCRPVGLQKVPGNHIFDEDQSVKWNREQVELNNKKYQSEVARLNTEKNKARDSVYNLIIEKIQYEVGHRLSRKKAEAIWNRAYEDGHSFGFYEITPRKQTRPAPGLSGLKWVWLTCSACSTLTKLAIARNTRAGTPITREHGVRTREQFLCPRRLKISSV